MYRIAILIVEWLLTNGARLLLTSLAISFVSSAVILTAFNSYLDRFLQNTGNVDLSILGLAAIAGVHIALSMIIGALVYVMTLRSLLPRMMKR